MFGANSNNKKKKISKEWHKWFREQEKISSTKDFIPGQIKFNQSQNSQLRLVNFFGDVHTQVFSLKVSHDEKYVGAACQNGQIRIYNIYEGNLLMIGNSSRLTGYPCTGFNWKPKNDKEFITCSCDGTIRWFNRGQQTQYAHHQNTNNGYLSCEYQIQGEWSAFGTDKGQIQIFDEQKKQLKSTYQNLNNNLQDQGRIFSIKSIKEDINLFFTGSWDSTIQVFDIRTHKQSIRKFYGPIISSDSLDYKNGTILVGNYRNKDIAQLWDFKSGQLIENLNINEPQNGNSYSFGAKFAQKSDKDLLGIALTGSNKIKILKNKVLSGQIQFQATPLALDFYQFQKKDFLLAAGIQGTIYVVKLQFKDQNKLK